MENLDLEFLMEANKSGDNSLHDWFNKSKSSDGTKGWVQLGGKFAGKPCARQPGQTSTPKCGSSKMKRNLSKKEEERAFRRKNRQDPNQPNKSGGAKPTNVKTEGKTYNDFMLNESRRALSKALKGAATGVTGEIATRGKETNLTKIADGADKGATIGGTVRNALAKHGGKLSKIAGKTSGLGTALGVGAGIGQAYKNTNRAPAVSGRGAGRATFNNNSTPGAKLNT